MTCAAHDGVGDAKTLGDCSAMLPIQPTMTGYGHFHASRDEEGGRRTGMEVDL
jgi:hypothetical protein